MVQTGDLIPFAEILVQIEIADRRDALGDSKAAACNERE